eukprot:scaffold109663_cov63-Phaeocystis_antarctica.AAC.1
MQGKLGAQLGAQLPQQRRVCTGREVDIFVGVKVGGARGERRGVVVELHSLERVGRKQRPQRRAVPFEPLRISQGGCVGRVTVEHRVAHVPEAASLDGVDAVVLLPIRQPWLWAARVARERHVLGPARRCGGAR